MASSILRLQRSRSVAVPEVTASRLEEQLEKWMEQRGSRDVGGMVGKCADGVTWKTAPKASFVSSIADLLLLRLLGLE